MNIIKRIVGLFIGLLILSSLLAACGNSGTNPVSNLPVAAQGLIAKGRQYYNDGVNRETQLTQLYRAFEQSMNTFRTGARDLIANNSSCYKSVAETESAIAQAVMGNQTGAALINALATQSVSGEAATVECTKLNRQLADFTVSRRQEVQDKYLQSFNQATGYMNFTSNFPEIDIMNDLLQTYGDTTKVYKALADNGIGVSDWSWLPTANLFVTHSDEKLCRYYISGDFMQNISYSTKLKFTNHQDALARLYESSWNPAANGGRGECRMTRYAALEYMTRSILSSDTRQNVETGNDTGVFDTPVPTKEQ